MILVLFTVPLNHILLSRYLVLVERHFSSDILVPFPDLCNLYSCDGSTHIVPDSSFFKMLEKEIKHKLLMEIYKESLRRQYGSNKILERGQDGLYYTSFSAGNGGKISHKIARHRKSFITQSKLIFW